MKVSKSVQVLSGTLVLLSAAAAAIWLFVVPRDRGMSDAHARRIGYRSAAQRNQTHKLDREVRRQKRFTEAQAKALASGLRDQSPAVRIMSLVTLETLTKRATDPAQRERALRMIQDVADHPDPEMRKAVQQALSQIRPASAPPAGKPHS